jgi:hypothetical protein
MNVNAVLNELQAERQRIDAAIAALESLDSTATATAMRRRPAAARKPAKRRMSAAGRARIIAATKARWARFRAAKAAAAGKHVKKARVMSAAARRKIAAAARARWAKIKAAQR